MELLRSPYVRLLRPQQWIKNGFVLVPLLFSTRYADGFAWAAALLAMLCFVLASSAVYVINDIYDQSADRQHPLKRSRPLASGEVKASAAWRMAMGLLAAALFAALPLSPSCAAVLLIYIALSFAYCRWLKHMAIVDVLVIAIGFVLRVRMGGYAAHVPLSPWIIIATFMLALFLGFGKRRHEMENAGGNGRRKSLDAYTLPLLDSYIIISCGAALIAYALYAVEIAERQGGIGFTYTTLFVAFGLFRYLQAVHCEAKGGEPEKVLFTDRLFLLNLGSWLLVSLWILHR